MKKGYYLYLAALCFWAGLQLTSTATARSSDPAHVAGQILEITGVRGGLVIHIACGKGELTAALHNNDSYLVQGLDTDAENIENARVHIKSLGLYGTVSVEQWDSSFLPYTDNLANLVVSEDLGKVPLTEVMRVLCPEGVAYIKKNNTWIKMVKPRPPEIDEWTHYLHDPSNNAVAHDSVVAPPYHYQWIAGARWARSHDHLASVSAAVSTGGRIFYIADEGSISSVALPDQWSLIARDGFNGVLLWKRRIEPWEDHLRGFRSGPAGLARRLVAVNDRVYVTLGYGKEVTALEAATGKTIKNYEKTDGTEEIIFHDNVLYLVVGDPAEQLANRKPDPDKKVGQWYYWPIYKINATQKHILTLNSQTGDVLWEKSNEDTAEIMPTTLALNNDRVFFQNPREVICLDAKSGKEIWGTPRPIGRDRLGWSTPTLVVKDNVVLSADRGLLLPDKKEKDQPEKLQWTIDSRSGIAPVGELIAFSARTGEKLWSCPCREVFNQPVDVLVADGLVWTGELLWARDPGITQAHDLKTGEVKRQRLPDSEFFNVGMTHHRCYRNRATDRYLILGRAGVEFIELASGKAFPNHWVRGTCQYGIMPCNGLLYTPPHSCACYIEAKLNSFNALAPKRVDRGEAISRTARLEHGPAYGKTEESKSAGPADWPTYRHDPARSGRTNITVPCSLKPAWQSDIGGKLTSPVIADGKLFVASVDTHTVHALDAESGKHQWDYTTSGRVDSPPTIYKGMVLFGSADGWVYCLCASDGKMAWRFRAAPEDRRIVAYGQLESAWPVPGNLLIQNDVAYCVAGRSSYLDGGIYLYRLDPLTGKILSKTRLDSRDPQTGQQPKGVIKGVSMPGALPDILSSDGSSVFMRHKRFDLAGVEQEENVPHLYSPAGFLDDSWWHRTYWVLGTIMKSGWGSWPQMGNESPAGRLLVVDDSKIYGFGRSSYQRDGSHPGLNTHYHIFAADRKPLVPEKVVQKKAKKQPDAPPIPFLSKVKYYWRKQIPFIVRAMVLADKTLFIAGPPDMIQRKDKDTPADVNSKEAFLCAVDTGNGEILTQYNLDCPPVFDGMIGAQGHIYITTLSGQVLCMGPKD